MKSKFITCFVVTTLVAALMATPVFAKSKKCDCGCDCKKCKCEDKDKDEPKWIVDGDGRMMYYFPTSDECKHHKSDCKEWKTEYTYWQPSTPPPAPQQQLPPPPPQGPAYGEFNNGHWEVEHKSTENTYTIVAYPTGQPQVVYVAGLGNVLIDGSGNVVSVY